MSIVVRFAILDIVLETTAAPNLKLLNVFETEHTETTAIDQL